MSTSPAPSHPPTPSHHQQQQQQQQPPPGVSDQDWALRLEQEKRMTQQLAAKNEALNSQQQFVVERAADMALQQQQRIAQLEAQLGAAAPAVPGDSYSSGNGNNNNSSRTPSAQQQQQQQNSSNNTNTSNNNIINVRHGCPRCSTCNTLLQTVGQLETMLQNRDSDCDVLRKALDDAQRVNALLLEQIDLLQRGLEKALLNRHIPQDFQGPAKQLPLHHSVSPPSIHHTNHTHQQQEAASASSESNTNNNTSGSEQQKEPIASFNSSNLPANMRMLQPSSEPTLRAMADAVASLQNLWLDMSSSPASSRYKPAPAVPPSKLDV